MSYSKIEIESDLNEISEDKKVLFCTLTCEKLLPNYEYFHQQTGWGNPEILKEGLVLLYDFVLKEHFNKKEVESLLAQIDLIIPDTEDFESIEVSFALDAANAVHNTLNYLLNRSLNYIFDIITNATDTVDMFIEEKYDLDMSQKDSERIISEDALMIREKDRQANLIKKLKGMSLKRVTSEIVKDLRDIQPIIELDNL